MAWQSGARSAHTRGETTAPAPDGATSRLPGARSDLASRGAVDGQPDATPRLSGAVRVNGDAVGPTEARREFVGFAWSNDWGDKTGLLVLAVDATEAKALAEATLGNRFHVSLWNEDDANAAR